MSRIRHVDILASTCNVGRIRHGVEASTSFGMVSSNRLQLVDGSVWARDFDRSVAWADEEASLFAVGNSTRS